MQTLVTVIHVITCVLLILVVLIQSGKGAEISTSLAGSSQTVFGSSGGANFFTRFTSAAAAIFMVTSVALTVMGGQSKKSVFVGFEKAPATQQTSVPSASPSAGASENSPAAAKP